MGSQTQSEKRWVGRRKREKAEPQKAAIGRPRLEVNPATVQHLAKLGFTQAEIGESLGVSEDTIQRRYAGDFHAGREERREMIAAGLLEVAQDADSPMARAKVLIHLAQLSRERGGLGHARELQLTGKDGGPVQLDIAERLEQLRSVATGQKPDKTPVIEAEVIEPQQLTD